MFSVAFAFIFGAVVVTTVFGPPQHIRPVTALGKISESSGEDK